VVTPRSGYGRTTLLSGKSRDKQTDFAHSPSQTKASISKSNNQWTHFGSEDIALPEFCQIMKTTDVDVERDVRHSLGLDLEPNFKPRANFNRGLESTLLDARKHFVGHGF